MQASGSNAGPAIAYSPAPYALRTITEIFGTVASDTAEIIFAPCADDALALDLRCRS